VLLGYDVAGLNEHECGVISTMAEFLVDVAGLNENPAILAIQMHAFLSTPPLFSPTHHKSCQNIEGSKHYLQTSTS
jgi:hypothetical protein